MNRCARGWRIWPLELYNAMTHCPTEDVLLDYVAGSLNAAQAAEFERHLKECSRCDAVIASQAAVWRSLDEWKPEPVTAGFNRELWRRIDAEAAPSWWAGLHFWKQVAPLAAVLALVVTGFVMDQHSHAPVRTPAAVTASTSEVDQLERALDDLQLLEAVDTASSVKPAADLM
jgi:anti-sigma factor RsiW